MLEGVVFANYVGMANIEKTQGIKPGKNNDEETTGTPNLEYNLISILYHALQGGETYAKYLEDCKDIGDEELTGFMHECIDQERERAAKAKRILMRHLGGQQGKSMKPGMKAG